MAEPARRGFETPQEVLDYFDEKRLRPAFSWQDVWGEEHAYAFTVAKATEADLLRTFHRSISTALKEGQGFETWREGIKAELSRQGWWRPRTVSDPTGQDPDAIVDYSRPRRLHTIFWSNMRSARSAGQWQRVQRTKRVLPYILYVRTAAADPRPEHLGWVGIILPVDDPFWRTHWPPNGWGCQCSVRQISAREAEQLLGTSPEEGGIIYRDEAPEDGPPLVFRNRRTGAVTEIPQGIDPGWHTNAGLGRARTLTRRLEETLIGSGADAARTSIRRLFATPAPSVLARLPERVRLPVAVAPEAARSLGARHALVVAGNDTIRAKSTKHAAVSIETFGRLEDWIARGVVIDQGQSGRRSVFVEEDGQWWRIILTRSRTGYLRIQTVHRIDAERAERLIEEAAGRT